MLSRFHLIPERYGRTDGQTDGQTDRFDISISRISILRCWRAIKMWSHVFLNTVYIPLYTYTRIASNIHRFLVL